ncbi:MAG: UDP-N-acetylglucosamine--N-acetylmuramyl-(pentapeptide) pyrophosphoryl-undecaprenol N-acetylglucosamine transferase [Acidimicrobiales bacterium]
MVRRYALIAGGGTAGHLQPALAIAEALVLRGHRRDTIEFVGSRRGQDSELLSDQGFPYTLLPGRGIRRTMRPKAMAQNARAFAGLAVALMRATALVARRRPRIVVSVGGYAGLPASLGALAWGVPLILVNVDAVPGAANRLVARFARASAVGWAGTALPRSVVTGTPVRPEIARVGRSQDDRRNARRTLGLPENRLTVVAFGGSLGARRINAAVEGLAERWSDREDRSIYHIVGRRDWTSLPCGASGTGLSGVVVRVPYEERMAAAYAAADVVVCRAGAMTVAELAVAGVPSVLVPLPGAPGDHQTANARILESAGAALLLGDAACDGSRLEAILDGLLDDGEALGAMGRAALSIGRPDAADAGAQVVEEHARSTSHRRVGS